MKNKIINTLKEKAERALSKIKPTETDIYQFEKNLRNKFIYEHVSANLEHTLRHESYIGKKVRKFQDRFAYILEDEYNNRKDEDSGFSILNKLEAREIEFTEQLFNEFLEEYISYQIEYITYELLNKQLVSSSTNKLSNIAYEFKIESNQELYKFFKELHREFFPKKK
jgi:hypothetical protein